MEMSVAPSLRERFQGCFFGLAVGDATVRRTKGCPAI